MAPTKCKLEKTNVGEEVLDLVMPYIHDIEDRNSVSLVSRKLCEIDGIMRKRVTVHTLYYPNPASLSKRFPFIESLTLKGPPRDSNQTKYHDMRITPWIEQLALEFRYLKDLHICRLVVRDEDLETLAGTRGKDLRSLKISMCKGISTDGLRHVSKYCNQLKTLCLKCCYHIEGNDATWLHQLALNSTVLERFHVMNTGFSDAEYLTLLAKNCCNSLISLKIGACYLSKLGDAFRYAVRLEHFGGRILYEQSELVNFQLPPNTRSLSIRDFAGTEYLNVLPFLNQITKLRLVFVDCHCLLFERCPNLEVLVSPDVCGDKGLQVIRKFCKKLRKLTHNGEHVTQVGLIALAKGCTKLECLTVRLGDTSHEAIKCLGTHLKNLRKLRMDLFLKDWPKDPLDNVIQAMLMGCRKLERLDITLWPLWRGGLTDMGLEYIGKYGANLRYLSLTCIGNSEAGLVKLSEGCPKLRKLKLSRCPFSEQVVTSSVFNIPSLRYVWFDSDEDDSSVVALTRPGFQL